MKIKDYKCKCGHNDFFFVDKGNQKGIYCSYCGKWLKWADKDEQNLAMEQEPILEKINKMKSEIASSLEFWDYSPNNNPLARDILETVTHFWGDIKSESEDKE